MKTLKHLLATILFSKIIFAQSIAIGSGSSIEVGSGSDVCAGVYGNITGNFGGSGTQCNQSLIQTFQLSVSVVNGWNMVSVPGLHPANQNVNTWWSGKDPAAGVFQYNGIYSSVTDVTPGVGYWMKHFGSNTYNTGDEWPAGGIQVVPNTPLSGSTGWNLISGYHLAVPSAGVTTTPPGIQQSPLYVYSSMSGYTAADSLRPGDAYWVRLSQPGQINIPANLDGIAPKSFDNNIHLKGKIVIKDAENRTYNLFVLDEALNNELYMLPPPPPEGMFDVRFSSNQFAEHLSAESKSIILSGVTYPVTLKTENATIKFQDVSGKAVNNILNPGEELIISNPAVKKIIVSMNDIPDDYSLNQNFPNPFNPSTKISWQSPVGSHQTLKIYDVLGNEVATLVDEYRGTGRYEIEFDATRLASGIYIYKLQAGNNTFTKKMAVIK